jgi:oxygen-independent coproporphyrinogen III oxidase
MQGDIVPQTVAAIIGEIKRSPWRGRPAKTIFFGGGTPTFLDEESLISIFEAVLVAHPPAEDAEVTSEANPGTVDQSKFASMKKAGFNRISLGAQSFLDSDLIALERVHKAGDIERAVHAARRAGFTNINLDLMFALPNQSLHGWRSNLKRALALQPEHLSLYCLTIEPNTAFYKRNLRGQLSLPDDEMQVTMYEECIEKMGVEGYDQYEISNFAKPGRECLHNLEYWYGNEYAGYGPGAVGMVAGVRYTNLKHPIAYVEAVNGGASLPFESETLSPDTLRVERIMLGLRLNEGLDVSNLGVYRKDIDKLIEKSWLEESENRIRLTSLGRHFCSEVALGLI